MCSCGSDGSSGNSPGPSGNSPGTLHGAAAGLGRGLALVPPQPLSHLCHTGAPLPPAGHSPGSVWEQKEHLMSTHKKVLKTESASGIKVFTKGNI